MCIFVLLLTDFHTVNATNFTKPFIFQISGQPSSGRHNGAFGGSADRAAEGYVHQLVCSHDFQITTIIGQRIQLLMIGL